MAAALLGVPAGAVAGTGGQRTSVLVTATVLKHASLKILAQPAAVVVTAEDVARGHVDVPAPVQVALRSNSGGSMLEFASDGDFMRRIVVAGAGGDVEFSPAGGLVTTMHPAGATSNLALTFRFVLSEGARAGTYPWPMRLSVLPL